MFAVLYFLRYPSACPANSSASQHKTHWNDTYRLLPFHNQSVQLKELADYRLPLYRNTKSAMLSLSNSRIWPLPPFTCAFSPAQSFAVTHSHLLGLPNVSSQRTFIICNSFNPLCISSCTSLSPNPLSWFSRKESFVLRRAYSRKL